MWFGEGQLPCLLSIVRVEVARGRCVRVHVTSLALFRTN